MALYWLVQICGGVLAGKILFAMCGDGVAVQPGEGYTWHQGACAEILYTAVLCFVVAHTAVSKGNNPENDSNQFYALAIGFVIVAGGYAVGSISGACFNPAVSIGLNASRGIFSVPTAWPFLWSACQLIGSGIAAVLFSLMRPQDAGVSGILFGGEASLMIKCLSEFLGVFVLVMTVGLNVVTKSPATALSAAGALMSMIYALGYVSGAHFNPAVTLAVVLSGRDKCSPSAGVAYVLSQALAAVFAGHLYAGFHVSGPNKDESFPLAPRQGHSLRDAGIVELFFTAVLAYTVLSVATVTSPMLKKTTQCFYFGLAIAACVIAGGFAIGGISGGELNPAVSLGMSVANLGQKSQDGLSNFVPLSFWELSGGVIAAVVFRITHNGDYSTAFKM
jgi:aquaporin Z